MIISLILITIVTSFLTSILVGRFYLNWQYHESNSGYRQSKIIIATKEFIDCILNNNKKLSIDILRKKHRNSLGIIIERCIYSFEISDNNSHSIYYPLLFDLEKDNNWNFYDKNIRSVIVDLNNNAFIGWIPWILNVKRMKTLWYFTHTLETIIEIQEILQAYEAKNSVKIFSQKSIHCVTINQTGINTIDIQINEYINCMNTLKKYWYQWKSLL